MTMHGTHIPEPSIRQLALVLGATGGIGQAFCEELASRGFDLVISGRNVTKLESLAARLASNHRIAVEYQIWDLAKPDDVHRIARYLDENKRLTWFINSSGQAVWGRFHELSIESQTELFQVNLMSSVKLLHAAIRAFRHRNQGSIIFVASAASFFSVPYISSYCATKSGLVQLLVSVHEELASTGLRIQALCPGFVKTDMFTIAGADTNRIPPGIWLPPERIVRESLKAIGKNKAIVIPGKRYRLMLWITKWGPASISRRVTGWIFGSFERFRLR
jgi:uncharacterized protein